MKLWPRKKRERPSEEEIHQRIRALILDLRPELADMPEHAFDSVYVLNDCLVCGIPRYAHHGRARRHLIAYGGTG